MVLLLHQGESPSPATLRLFSIHPNGVYSVHASTTQESSISREWEAANAEKDDIKRSKQIAELLNKIPKGNKTNIEFLFDFLARLNGEEVFCHEDTVSVLLLKKAHASRVPLIASRARR